jgi:hypothetical protein
MLATLPPLLHLFASSESGPRVGCANPFVARPRKPRLTTRRIRHASSVRRLLDRACTRTDNPDLIPVFVTRVLTHARACSTVVHVDAVPARRERTARRVRKLTTFAEMVGWSKIGHAGAEIVK